MSHRPLIIAHRGASANAPENTLIAYLLSFMQGADGIEVDLRLTADDQLVAVHDEDLKRTGGSSLKVASTPLEKLRTIDVGRSKERRALIPVFHEVAELIPEGKLLYLDVKADQECVPALVRELKKCRLKTDQIRLTSRSPELLRVFQEVLPQYPRHLQVDRQWTDRRKRWMPEASMLTAVAKTVDAVGISVDAHSYTEEPGLREGLQESGIGIHIFTVNRAPSAQRLADTGVQSIETDYPGHLVKNLRESVASEELLVRA